VITRRSVYALGLTPRAGPENGRRVGLWPPGSYHYGKHAVRRLVNVDLWLVIGDRFHSESQSDADSR
jgi:hypothetical protein